MQSGVTVSCFFLSYVIVLALELSRLYTRMPWRMAIVVMMAILGLVTHGLFLWDRWMAESHSMGQTSLPATLFDWGLLAAWVLAAIYVFLAIRRPSNAIGPFLLPLVLAMILGALSVRSGQPFDRSATSGLWRYIHGGSLSIGTVAVTLGLAVAMMNLVQEYRLKTKRGMAGSLRLPSLEYLHTLGRGCLVVSTIAIACGLVSGVVLNFQRNGSVNWLESGIVFSGGLLVWLVIASFLEWRASLRASSWAAYLNIASFLIVFLSLILVFAAPHGRTPQLPTMIPTPRSQSPVIIELSISAYRRGTLARPIIAGSDGQKCRSYVVRDRARGSKLANLPAKLTSKTNMIVVLARAQRRIIEELRAFA